MNPNKSLIIIIKQTIVHGLYNPLNPISPYIIKKHPNDLLICTKRFPREFNETIIVNIDGYPIYQRRYIMVDEIIIWGLNDRFNNLSKIF